MIDVFIQNHAFGEKTCLFIFEDGEIIQETSFDYIKNIRPNKFLFSQFICDVLRAHTYSIDDMVYVMNRIDAIIQQEKQNDNTNKESP